VRRDDALTWAARALAALAVGEGAAAVHALEQARACSPDLPPLLAGPTWEYWLGLAYAQARLWDEAIRSLRAHIAAADHPFSLGWAYVHLGGAYEAIGHDEEAALAYRRCLALPAAERAARRAAFQRMRAVATRAGAMAPPPPAG